MVHALTEAWRVVKPNASVIDLRPITGERQLEVVGASGSIAAGDLEVEPDEDDEMANAAVAQVVAGGLFRLDQSARFDFALYWDTADEAVAYAEERWSHTRLPAAVAERASQIQRAMPGRLRCTVTMIANSLKRLD